MKTNARAWRIYRVRIWAGLLALLVLALAQFGLVFRFNRDCGGGLAQPDGGSGMYSPADWLAAN